MEISVSPCFSQFPTRERERNSRREREEREKKRRREEKERKRREREREEATRWAMAGRSDLDDVDERQEKRRREEETNENTTSASAATQHTMGTASQAQAQAQVYQRVFGSKDVISSSLAEVTLMNDATGVEYFLECYLRLEVMENEVLSASMEEGNHDSMQVDPPLSSSSSSSTSELVQTLVGIRHLVVSYAGHVISGLIGGNASERTAELYNAAIEGKVPESFWYAFADRFSSSEDETLSLCIIPLIRQLGKAFTLENQKPLDFLSHLLSIKAIAAALVKSEDWLPLAKLTTGRSIEYESLLGPFFTVSVLPDIFHGNVMKEYMGGTQQQVAVGIKTLRMRYVKA